MTGQAWIIGIMTAVIVFETTWLLKFWRLTKKLVFHLSVMDDQLRTLKEMTTHDTREEQSAAHRPSVDGSVGG